MTKLYQLTNQMIIIVIVIVTFLLITFHLLSSTDDRIGSDHKNNLDRSSILLQLSKLDNYSNNSNLWQWFQTSHIKQTVFGDVKLEFTATMGTDESGNIILKPHGDIIIKKVKEYPSFGHPKGSIDIQSGSSLSTESVTNTIHISTSNNNPHESKQLGNTPHSISMKSSTQWTSPQTGTDILTDPNRLIAQYNQSRILIPKLDLKRSFRVYFCKHLGHGVRFFFLSREGLLLHPLIQLVNHPNQAEYIIYLPTSSPWERTECNRPEYRNKTIILDEGDGPGLFEVRDNVLGAWFLYFKRSFVSRHRGIFQGYMNYLSSGKIMPMTYTTAEAYIKLTYTSFIDRDLEILCTLRGSNHDPVRLRVREWVEEYIRARGIKNAIAGQINSASRTVISNEYFNNMYRAKIIVTSNPSGWEGDFRFCEALSSGALIMIDHMYVPRPHPFIDNQHIVYYDNNNKTDLFEKLDYYRQQKKLAAVVAMQGYLHAMKYHRAVNLIDYVFKTVHQKHILSNRFGNMLTSPTRTQRDELKDPIFGTILSYDDTGYDMLEQARENVKRLRIRLSR